jgi:hypothetical protein
MRDRDAALNSAIPEATSTETAHIGANQSKHGPEDRRDLILAEAAGFTGSLPQADDETLLIALLSQAYVGPTRAEPVHILTIWRHPQLHPQS